MREAKLFQRFGRRVQQLRKAKGMSQEVLADKIGKTTNTVSNIERGVYPTGLDTIAVIAQTLGVSPAELFEREPGDDANGEKRREIMKLVDLLKDQDVATIKAAQYMMAYAMDVRRTSKRKRKSR